MRRITPFLTSQSMGTKDICILVVHDDPIYRDIIAEMLRNCSHYEVLKFESMADALNVIREKKDRLNIVITDVHRSNSNGFEILQYIEKEFKLPVISMSPHENAKVMSVGLGSGAKLYLVKSLSVNDFKNLWQYAYTKERGKANSVQRVMVLHEKEVETSLENTSPIHEASREDKKHKRRELNETDEQSEGNKDDTPNEKKQRVVWTEQMHQKFLEAIQQLGHDRAFPKKIVEVMNVPGLTRENVASHLQKYRMCLKRAQEAMQATGSVFGINLAPPGRTCFPSSHSNFNPSQRNLQCHMQDPIVTSYEPRLSNINFPMSASNFSHSYHPEMSTSTSNLGQQQLLMFNNLESLKNPIGQQPLSLDATVENNTNHLNTETTQPNSSPVGLISSSNNSTYVGFRLTGDGASVKCGQTSIQSNIKNTAEKQNFSEEGNGNESLVKYQSITMDNNSQQQFYLPPAVCEVEDLLDETGGASPQMIWDFDNSLLAQNR